MASLWYPQHRTRPCKKRKDGAPRVLKRERRLGCERPGHPAPPFAAPGKTAVKAALTSFVNPLLGRQYEVNLQDGFHLDRCAIAHCRLVTPESDGVFTRIVEIAARAPD